jgi:hypothetical protein
MRLERAKREKAMRPFSQCRRRSALRKDSWLSPKVRFGSQVPDWDGPHLFINTPGSGLVNAFKYLLLNEINTIKKFYL